MSAMLYSETTPIASPEITSRLLSMWLYGRSPHTIDSYRRHAQRFFAFVGKPLTLVTLADVQGWQESLRDLSPNSQGTAISAIRSLLAFSHRIGVLDVNVGLEVKAPNAKDCLNERILSEAEVIAMLEAANSPRDSVLLRLLYSGGLRVSELCALKWRDLKQRGDAGQVTVFGKGGKTRTILLPTSVWEVLCQLKGTSESNDPVFRSREGGGHLDRSQVYRIVAATGKRAGIPGKVSPHWLRHAHASHSLERGAPIHLVQQTLGHASVATTTRYLHARPNDSSALYLPS